MGERTTETRTIAKPIKWTQKEWDAVEKFAKLTGISPTNLPRVLTLSAIGFGPMGEYIRRAKEFATKAVKASSNKRKAKR